MSTKSPSSLLAQLPTVIDANGHFDFSPDAQWSQGRTFFGGLIAAAGLRALKLFLRHSREDEPSARTVTTTFEKPLGVPTTESPIVGTCTVLHHGKRVVSAEALFRQNDVVTTRVHVIFGANRASNIHVPTPVATPTPAVDALESMPFFEGLAPNFTRFVDFRWAQGAFPFSSADTSSFQGYCRWKESAAHCQEELLALLDAWPAPVLCLANGPIPASSVIWTAHLFPEANDGNDDAGDRNEDSATPYYWVDADTLGAQDGYATSIAHLHDERGHLLAWGEQLVAYFD